MMIQKSKINSSHNMQCENLTNAKIIDSVSASQLLDALNILQKLKNKDNKIQPIRQEQLECQTANMNISFCQNSISFTSTSIQKRKNDQLAKDKCKYFVHDNKKLNKRKSSMKQNNRDKSMEVQKSKSKNSTNQKIANKNNNLHKNNQQNIKNKMKFQFYMSKKQDIKQQKNISKKGNQSFNQTELKTDRLSLTCRYQQNKNVNKTPSKIKAERNLNRSKIQIRQNLTSSQSNNINPSSSRSEIKVKTKYIYKNEKIKHQINALENNHKDKYLQVKKQRIKTEINEREKSPISSNLNVKGQKPQNQTYRKESDKNSSIHQRTVLFLKNKQEKISKIQQAKKKEFEEQVQKECTFRPKIIKNWKKPVVLQQKKNPQETQSLSKFQPQSQQQFNSRIQNFGFEKELSKKATQKSNVSIKKCQKGKNTNKLDQNCANLNCLTEIKDSQKRNVLGQKTTNIFFQIKKNSKQIQVDNQGKQKQQDERQKQNNKKHTNKKFNILLDLIH